MSASLACDMPSCSSPARFIDSKGWVYCAACKVAGRGRKLTRAELERLAGGGVIAYEPKPATFAADDIAAFARKVEVVADPQRSLWYES